MWPAIAPGRFATGICTDNAPDTGSRVALVGLPDDLGVRLNNGRVGAASGPTAFRAALAMLGTPYDAEAGSSINVGVWDAGDVTPAPGDSESALHETHGRVVEALRSIHELGMLPVCVGGGHDLTFPAVRALSEHLGASVGGVNIDPHLDVRETVGSGMAFRALIEGGWIDARRFCVLGAGRFSNSESHAKWLRDRGGLIVPESSLGEEARFELRRAVQRAGAAGFVSFDLDSIGAAHAPGVSALNPCGMLPREAVALAEIAGAEPNVRHFDLMELNPAHDEQGRTARLSAWMFLHFLAGYARRGARAEETR